MNKFIRKHIKIMGAVQGVGFRPFVYNLAVKYNLTGTVSNTSAGVYVEIQGDGVDVKSFERDVVSNAPRISIIDNVIIEDKRIIDENSFTIIKSVDTTSKTVTILPDLATCPDCLRDISDKENPRYHYPFTNCTYCGPRFSIINNIPYDRPLTEMKAFKMCNMCQSEYENPADRRFHAQPNACPSCGPRISIIGEDNLDSDDVIKSAKKLLKTGGIIALKGIGGFQLLCDATNNSAIKRLRNRKKREEKPFALMVKNIEIAQQICNISSEEQKLLESVAAPIVLLEKKDSSEILLSEQIAPNNPNIGVMLPYSPLHHLLFNNNSSMILVCTSANIHDEPIAIDNLDAHTTLSKIADKFLIHNRPIARQIDDSVVRATTYGTQYFRRARGYAPFPIIHKKHYPNILSVGAHLKNTIAITSQNRTVMSQHIGDLSNTKAYDAFLNIIEDLPRLYDFQPELVACDYHPDYLSTRYAKSLGLPVVEVQHHHAHIASVMAEHDIDEPVLGISWDGTGLGLDDTIWGGEFLICENGQFERFAHLRNFQLPGGDLATKEPQRSAMGILHQLNIDYKLNHNWKRSDYQMINSMIDKKINAPQTSSMGRLFDAVSSILDIRQTTVFEGQSAMMLEFCAENTSKSYHINIKNKQLDWRPMINQIIIDKNNNVAISEISGRFHNTLINLMVNIAQQSTLKTIALSGGVFQNKRLYENGICALQNHGFTVITNNKIPTNDGGIALGQAWVAGNI